MGMKNEKNVLVVMVAWWLIFKERLTPQINRT